jgi:nucleoid DNA-binding protein
MPLAKIEEIANFKNLTPRLEGFIAIRQQRAGGILRRGTIEDIETPLRIVPALQNGESISLVGFSTFAVKARAARDGRNPQTGATIKIAAAKLPGFKAGKTLKDAVN